MDAGRLETENTGSQQYHFINISVRRKEGGAISLRSLLEINKLLPVMYSVSAYNGLLNVCCSHFTDRTNPLSLRVG